MRLRVLFCVTAAQALTIPSLTSRFAAAPPALTRLEQLQARLSQGAATTAAVGATCLALTLMPETACAAMISQEAALASTSTVKAAPGTASVEAELAAIQASRKAAEAELKAAKQAAAVAQKQAAAVTKRAEPKAATAPKAAAAPKAATAEAPSTGKEASRKVAAEKAAAEKESRAEKVDLTESYGTLTALSGLLALAPLTRLDAKRLNKIERLEGTAATAETAFGLLGSMTVFLTSRFELQYTIDDDVRLRVACAVVVVAAGTGATKAAFLAVNSRGEAEKKKQSNDKFIPIVGIFLTFFLSFITLKG